MNEEATYWNERYTHGSTPWDTGITPPEVVAFWEAHGNLFAPDALVVDVGCGTQTNLGFLAQQGIRAIGFDLSLVALLKGLQRHLEARAAGLRVGAAVADACAWPCRTSEASYVLDIGCLHTLEPDQRRAYVLELSRVLKPGAWYHLFCFQRLLPTPPDLEQRRFFLKGELEALLDEHFVTELEQVDEQPQDGKHGTWRLMRSRR